MQIQLFFIEKKNKKKQNTIRLTNEETLLV
jgi:hypothetical protein